MSGELEIERISGTVGTCKVIFASFFTFAYGCQPRGPHCTVHISANGNLINNMFKKVLSFPEKKTPVNGMLPAFGRTVFFLQEFHCIRNFLGNFSEAVPCLCCAMLSTFAK